MRQRLARQVLVLKRRTGPTAGETGPRCGRTCGATRQQRNDDILPVLNCALKKGALGKIPGFGWSSGPRGSINLGSQGKSPFIRWRNRPAGPALGSGQAAGEPAALPLIDAVAAAAIERVPGERRAAGLSAGSSVIDLAVALCRLRRQSAVPRIEVCLDPLGRRRLQLIKRALKATSTRRRDGKKSAIEALADGFSHAARTMTDTIDRTDDGVATRDHVLDAVQAILDPSIVMEKRGDPRRRGGAQMRNDGRASAKIEHAVGAWGPPGLMVRAEPGA